MYASTHPSLRQRHPLSDTVVASPGDALMAHVARACAGGPTLWAGGRNGQEMQRHAMLRCAGLRQASPSDACASAKTRLASWPTADAPCSRHASHAARSPARSSGHGQAPASAHTLSPSASPSRLLRCACQATANTIAVLHPLPWVMAGGSIRCCLASSTHTVE